MWDLAGCWNLLFRLIRVLWLFRLVFDNRSSCSGTTSSLSGLGWRFRADQHPPVSGFQASPLKVLSGSARFKSMQFLGIRGRSIEKRAQLCVSVRVVLNKIILACRDIVTRILEFGESFLCRQKLAPGALSVQAYPQVWGHSHPHLHRH